MDVDKHLDKKSIDIISDLITTPLITALFSVAVMPSRMDPDAQPFVHDILKDEPLVGYTTVAPKIITKPRLPSKSSSLNKASRRSVKSLSSPPNETESESEGKLNF